MLGRLTGGKEDTQHVSPVSVLVVIGKVQCDVTLREPGEFGFYGPERPAIKTLSVLAFLQEKSFSLL